MKIYDKLVWKGIIMGKKYKIALSYSRKDSRIERILEEELEKVFTGRVFTDMLRGEELANATWLKEKLQSIFRDTEYSIILYSKNYYEGNFTITELKAILGCIEPGKEPHFFIIKINDEQELPAELHGRTYVELEIPESFKKDGNSKPKNVVEDLENVTDQIRSIIHDQIIKFMITQTIMEKSGKEFSLNVHTTFAPGNEANWRMDYDWNLLGTAYIEEKSRQIKKDTTWQDFWRYLEGEFLWIKENLKGKPKFLLKMHFNCHLSIAYKLGNIYGDLGQASGNRNLVLMSSNRVSECVFPLEKEIHYMKIEDFCKEYEGNDSKSTDIACIISIKPRKEEKIVRTVMEFLNGQGMDYCKVYLFQKEMSIEDTNDLENMAEYLHIKMKNCRTGSKCKIHLFPDTTAPLMFALGAKTIFPGELQLYEYNQQEDSYTMSLKR